MVGPLNGHLGRLLHLGPYEDVSLRNQGRFKRRTAPSNFAAADHIRSHPDSIASAIQSLLIRAENCTGTGGGHFEQLL